MSILKHRIFTFPQIMGFIGPFVALFSIIIAISLSSWFTWDGNALSDLGHYGNGVPAAVVFNFGLVITAIIILHFVVWFILNAQDTLTKIGMLPFLIALGFAIIVMYDARGVRAKVGEHAKVLNKNFPKAQLEEYIGHTNWEVFIGMCLGVSLTVFGIKLLSSNIFLSFF